MSSILIIKTGSTVETARKSSGDFEDWIIDAMQRPADEFRVVNVLAGEKLPSYEELAGVVVTGSPAMVTDKLDWSEYTAKYLLDLEDKNIPVLGICYGHQLLAHAFGGKVGFHPRGREIGTTNLSLTDKVASDPLFGELETSFAVHTSHMQTVLEKPVDSEILAANEFEAHHALRYSEFIWGLQFHPEFDETVMKAYIQERKQDLLRENLEPEKMLTDVRPTPVSKSILEKFSRLLQAST